MSIIPVTRVQRTTLIAILSAISFGLMLFPQVPIIPSADFLKLDFSIVPVVIGLYWLNYSASLWVILIRTLLKLILANEGVNTYLGLPVNLLVVLAFITVLKITMPNLEQYSNWQKKNPAVNKQHVCHDNCCDCHQLVCSYTFVCEVC